MLVLPVLPLPPELMGEIPDSLSSFPTSSFRNNRVLCGPPLKKCKAISSDPTLSGGVTAPLASLNKTVASSPTGMPRGAKPTINPGNARRGKLSSLAIFGIILGDVVVLGLVSMLLYCYFWRNYSDEQESGKSSGSEQKMVYSYPNQGNSGQERGRIVFFEGVRRFELEDLLRASAEMLGKGGVGTAYKAILDDGNVVAVKRLKDLCVNGKKEFEQQMEVS